MMQDRRFNFSWLRVIGIRGWQRREKGNDDFAPSLWHNPAKRLLEVCGRYIEFEISTFSQAS